jgi:hypothetical protein
MIPHSNLRADVTARFRPHRCGAEAPLLPPRGEHSGSGFAGIFTGIGAPGITVPTEAAPTNRFVVGQHGSRIGEKVVRRFGLQRICTKRCVIQTLSPLSIQVGDSLWAPEARVVDPWQLFKKVLMVGGQFALILVTVEKL